MYKKFIEVTDPSIIDSIKVLHNNYNDRILDYYRISGNDLNRFSWFGDKKVSIFILKVYTDNVGEYK